MDFFAVVLVTVTILTICGICLFIFICALQPKVTRYLHRNKNRTYYITSSKRIKQIDSDLHINNIDLTTKSSPSIDGDKRAYLKVLERSIRTGRTIQDEKDNNNNNNNNHNSHSNSFYFLRQYVSKHLPSTTANTQTSTEI